MKLLLSFVAEHQNWFGMDETLGPVAASIKREVVERPGKLSSDSGGGAAPQPVYQYRVLIRTSEVRAQFLV